MNNKWVSGIAVFSILVVGSMGWADGLEDTIVALELKIQTLEKRLEQTELELKTLKAAKPAPTGIRRKAGDPVSQNMLYKYTTSHDGICLTGYLHGKLKGDIVLPTVIDGKSVVEISSKALYYNRDMASVTIPASITKIGLFNFSCCTNLSSIMVDDDNPSYSSEDGILFNKNKTQLIQIPVLYSGDYVIPDSVTGLGRSSFQQCNITSLTIPNSVTESGEYTFGTLPFLTDYIVSSNNLSFAANDGVLFSKDMKRLINFPAGRGGEYTVPDGVEVLGNGAFERNDKLTKINLPSTLKSIERDVFLKCSNLETIDLPESLEKIEPLSFCLSGIKKIHFPKNVKEVGSIAFRDCNNLTEISMDEENPNLCVEDLVIYSTDKTRLVTCMNSKQGVFVVPETVTTLGNWPFDSCNDLTEIHLPMSLKKMESGAFIRAGGITSIVIPPTIEFIDYYSFLGASKLKWVLFLGDAPKLHRNALMKCPPNLKIYYKESAKGFVSPLWNGIEAEACNEEKIEELLTESKKHLNAQKVAVVKE